MNKERQISVQKAVRLAELDLPSDLKNLSYPQCSALCDKRISGHQGDAEACGGI